MNKTPIFVINLKLDIAKKERMLAMLTKLNLEFSLFEAIDGKTLSEGKITTIYDKNHPRLKRQLSKGELGCAFSHLRIYQKMIDDNIKQAIILEDDAIIDKDFIDCLPIIDYAPQNWELILFGHSDSKNEQRHFCKVNVPTPNNPTKFSMVKPISAASGTYAYIINQNGAKKMLHTTSKLLKAIDDYTGNYQEVNLYAIYPHPVRVDFALPSSIDNSDKTAAISRAKTAKSNKLHQKISDFNRARKLKRKWSVNCFVKLLVYKIKNAIF